VAGRDRHGTGVEPARPRRRRGAMVTTLARPRGLPFHVRLRARLIRLVLLFSAIASLGALAGCDAAANLGVPGTGPLLTVSLEGGMCMDGPCDSAVMLERDGRVHSAAKPPNDLGRVSAQAYAALDAAIQATDFDAMRAKPFTGECPIAFDGQKQVFEFSVGGTIQRLDSCESELDWSSPVFIAMVAALGEWIQAPLF
jgi:hypothetical protein